MEACAHFSLCSAIDVLWCVDEVDVEWGTIDYRATDTPPPPKCWQFRVSSTDFMVLQCAELTLQNNSFRKSHLISSCVRYYGSVGARSKFCDAMETILSWSLTIHLWMKPQF